MARFKLSLMMLLQYMMCAVWWVPLAAYLANLEVGSTQKALCAVECLLLEFKAVQKLQKEKN